MSVSQTQSLCLTTLKGDWGPVGDTWFLKVCVYLLNSLEKKKIIAMYGDTWVAVMKMVL